MLHIYDANNVFRRVIETDSSGRPHRQFLAEIQSCEGVPIVVWDGKGSLQKRRDIYPEYKRNREPAAENIYAAMDLMKKILELSKAIQIEVPGYEADDVIAALTIKNEKYLPWIHSTDRDLTALPAYRIDAKPVCEDRFLVPIYKTLVGDPSDNIPGLPGFGEKAWLDCHQKAFQAWMAGHFDVLDHQSAERIMERFGVKKGIAAKLQDPEQVKKLRVFYRIINFLPVREQLMDECATFGLNRPDLIEPILARFML